MEKNIIKFKINFLIEALNTLKILKNTCLIKKKICYSLIGNTII